MKKRADAAGTRKATRDDPGAPAVAAASLYVVATPLGNLRDITLRAIDVLREVSVVAAEDTRVSAPLLRHFGSSARLVSLHAHNEASRIEEILALLAAGERVALISDAGTPAISDPGARVVRAVRDAGYRVEPIPGPSALAAAISAAGLAAERFVFAGFLPTVASARRDVLAALAPLPFALVFYEAPHRVEKTLRELAQALPGERMLVVAREITKAFETFARMPLAEGADWVAADADRTRGELVIVVDSPAADALPHDVLTPDAERWLEALLDELPPARAARIVARITGIDRDKLYARALELKDRTSDR
jgi:16S rRNA (cytidine1402-2'-O)-methyltransferase